MQSAKKSQLQIFSEESERFKAEVFQCLEQRPKRLPSHYMYDNAGSELFEQVTNLPNYYITRSEIGRGFNSPVQQHGEGQGIADLAF
ncbi:L-histidine N(alpha)-methyltransferase [Pseudovibrio sp. Tun.PSC04-5.I4]|uniref:L-histidine N(alpha)-methyltransferase n=1 Tax=Pseudovibrio sp. Tun.PSC04-5.I4 TaxID=1798213 RepID=UPI0013563774|nr:L-histidine N(alpha)-methyltransferase [Pseudovibrio sp. Tun.PSC04-5.I4]